MDDAYPAWMDLCELRIEVDYDQFLKVMILVEVHLPIHRIEDVAILGAISAFTMNRVEHITTSFHSEVLFGGDGGKHTRRSVITWTWVAAVGVVREVEIRGHQEVCPIDPGEVELPIVHADHNRIPGGIRKVELTRPHRATIMGLEPGDNLTHRTAFKQHCLKSIRVKVIPLWMRIHR